MTRRERARFERLVADVVHPGGALPAVCDTDATAAFERWLAAAPRPNRLALRALLRLGPRAGAAEDVLRRLAAHCYFGDDRVMRLLGYDAAAVVRRAQAR